MNFLDELKKRNVLRVGAAYLVVGWLVLQFIDVVFPMLGIDESLGKPVLILLLIGLPIALLLAWFLEITPDGVKREKDLDRSAMADQPSGRKMDRVIIVVLLAALSLLLFDRFVIKSAPSTEFAQAENDYSLAVLPFVNLSGNTQDEYFSDGLTETLLHMLAQIPELRVSARTSVFAFKGKGVDVRDIAESLGVDNVLEGSVQRSGNEVRITAQLIEASTGFHLWSRNFDRDLDDIFAVQDEIASSVASALQVTLLGVEQNAEIRMAGIATQDTGAYEFYLQGLEQKNIASYSSLPQAENLFKRALSMDPEFCEAKLELAYAYQLQADTGLLTSQESESRIRPLIDQVLEVRPSEGRALGLLATINWRNAILSTGPVSPASAAAQEDIERALELAPNDPALYAAMAQVHAILNNLDDALSWTEKGLVVDPMSARLNMQRGQFLLNLERPEDAVEAFAKARKQAPDWTAVLISSARADFRTGNFASGVEWYLESLDTDPQDHEIPSQLARTYYQLGLTDEGDRMYERARAIAPQEPWTRSLELGRQLRANNYERVLLLAEAIMRDDLENRGNAFSLAVGGYVSAMIELGKEELVPDFFESLIPGISSADYQPNDLKEVGIKFMIALSLASMGSYEAAEGILDPLIVGADATAPGWRDQGGIMMAVSIVQGDEAAAVQYALDDLSRSLSEQMNWELNYRHTAWVKPLLKNDRIASRLAELEAETQAAASSVRDMLATRISETG